VDLCRVFQEGIVVMFALLFIAATFLGMLTHSSELRGVLNHKQDEPAQLSLPGSWSTLPVKGSTMVSVKEIAHGVHAGKSINDWTALGKPFSTGNKDWVIVAQCKCGNVSVVYCKNLASGKSPCCRDCSEALKSLRQRTHGETVDGIPRLYRIWGNMKSRCTNPKTENYELYGGRGISVCAEWSESYIAFRDWAMANGYADDLEIDRYPNNDGNYEPSNCRWATQKANCRNRRVTKLYTAFEETKPLGDWAEDPRCAVQFQTLNSRVKRGWDLERALTTPLKIT
jgi:hypothetical protein